MLHLLRVRRDPRRLRLQPSGRGGTVRELRRELRANNCARLQPQRLHHHDRLVEVVVGDVELVRVPLPLDVDRLFLRLGAQEGDDLLHLEHPLLVEREHLEVEAQVRLEQVELAEVGVRLRRAEGGRSVARSVRASVTEFAGIAPELRRIARARLLHSVELAPHRALVDAEQLLVLRPLEHLPRLRDVGRRHRLRRRLLLRRRLGRHVGAHLRRELGDALGQVGGDHLEEAARLHRVVAQQRHQLRVLHLDHRHRVRRHRVHRRRLAEQQRELADHLARAARRNLLRRPVLLRQEQVDGARLDVVGRLRLGVLRHQLLVLDEHPRLARGVEDELDELLLPRGLGRLLRVGRTGRGGRARRGVLLRAAAAHLASNAGFGVAKGSAAVARVTAKADLRGGPQVSTRATAARACSIEHLALFGRRNIRSDLRSARLARDGA